MLKRINQLFSFYVLITFLLSHIDLLAVDKIVINHSNWDPSKIDKQLLDQVRMKKILYLHRSIGSNIVSGLMELESENPSRYALNITHAPVNPRFMNKPCLGHEMFLKLMANDPNRRSYYDTAEFDSTIRSQDANGREWGMVIDIAIFNVGWSGIRRHIDVEAFFHYYISILDSLISDYPACKFVYFTCPIKGNVNQEWQRLDNIACHQFNEMLRSRVDRSGGYLFDIADIQAYNDIGVPQVFRYKGREYPKMWYDPLYPTLNGWSSDGGHLNAKGEKRIALAMWSLWAKITISSQE